MSKTSAGTAVTLLATLALLLCAAGLRAQPIGVEQIATSGGTLYVVAFPDTTMNTFDARYPNRAYVDKAILMLYSAVDAMVSIKGEGYNKQVAMTGGRFSIVELMGGSAPVAAKPIINEHCVPVNNTFRIESGQPIVVYQYLVTKFGTEAWTPAPVEAWGSEYYAAAIEGEIGSDVSPGGEFDYNRKNKSFPAEILVIAAYDDTRITIVPNGQVQNFCRAENVRLSAGQAYQIQSYVDTLTANVGGDQPDFGGSRIFSTKPVGVISGNTRAQTIDENVGLGKNIFKNMLIEWLAPVEQHGTEFVYMPTWDARRPTGAPEEDPSEKRKAEFVRIYATTDTTSSTYSDSLGNHVSTGYTAGVAGFTQTRLKPSAASVFRSSVPAQAMMNAAAVVKYAGVTNGFGGYIGAAYDGWGGYMVELVPREQWVSFAPYYASAHPGGMEHFINVVTDTAHLNDIYLKNGSPFIFQRRIAGTDLIWGSMAVLPGIDNHLEGRNGATFAGFVYGGLVRGGHEEYRPGRTREREEEPPALAGAGDEPPVPMHPSEYEEYLAIAYGYPLISARRAVGTSGDSLGITTTSDCSGMCVDIRALNDEPVGLRTVRLESAVNAKILTVNPDPLTGAVRATACVSPINRALNGSATLVILDRSGRTTRVPFAYTAERIVTSTNNIDFGLVAPGRIDTLHLRVTNPIDRAITVRSVSLRSGGSRFRVTWPIAMPVTMAPGTGMTVVVEASPTQYDVNYSDTLVIKLECTTWTLPVTLSSAVPCIAVQDIDFGVLAAGESRTLPLRICNDGGGVLTFVNPTGGQLIEWLLASFKISPAELEKLSADSLAMGECADVLVTFSSSDTGAFRTTARIWASDEDCRDTSIWTATVVPPAAAPDEISTFASLEMAQPNPVTSTATIRFSLPRTAHATLALYDERGARVATLLDEARGAGSHTVQLDASALPAGAYHYRLDVGDWSQSRSFIRR